MNEKRKTGKGALASASKLPNSPISRGQLRRFRRETERFRIAVNTACAEFIDGAVNHETFKQRVEQIVVEFWKLAAKFADPEAIFTEAIRANDALASILQSGREGMDHRKTLRRFSVP